MDELVRTHSKVLRLNNFCLLELNMCEFHFNLSHTGYSEMPYNLKQLEGINSNDQLFVITSKDIWI